MKTVNCVNFYKVKIKLDLFYGTGLNYEGKFTQTHTKAYCIKTLQLVIKEPVSFLRKDHSDISLDV